MSVQQAGQLYHTRRATRAASAPSLHVSRCWTHLIAIQQASGFTFAYAKQGWIVPVVGRI
jgi:hypothetical protein